MRSFTSEEVFITMRRNFLLLPTVGCFCGKRFILTGPSFLKKKINVCIEGNIGSGKTTFLEYFRRFENLVEINEEPVQKWRHLKGHNPLGTLYENPKRWTFTFQSLVLTTLKEIHSKPQTKPVRLMERSLYSAMYCFIENQVRSGHLHKMEYAVLKEMFQFLTENNQLNIDLIVYLKTTPQVCFKRILDRQRFEEQGISMSYLEALHNLHEEWLVAGASADRIRPTVLVIDGNQNKQRMEDEFRHLLTQLQPLIVPAG